MPALLRVEFTSYWEHCPRCHDVYWWDSMYKPIEHFRGGLWDRARDAAIAEHVCRWVA